MTGLNIPYEPWQLIQAKEIISWIRANGNFSINSLNTLELVEDILFNEAYSKLGLSLLANALSKNYKKNLNEGQDNYGNSQILGSGGLDGR